VLSALSGSGLGMPRVDMTRYHGAFASIVFFVRIILLRFGSYEFIPVIG